jgi:carboxymethylenebutenolidase
MTETNPAVSRPVSRRRLVVAGAAGLPLAAILANPRLAALAAESTETVTATLPGGQSVIAALAVPDQVPAGGVVLVHEWWGLNNEIKTMAAEFAREGFVALAVDLYGGSVGATGEEAQALMQAVDPAIATETLATWVDWLRNDPRVNGKVATLGWCFGGGWALNAAIATPVEATVVYYGRVNRETEDLAMLSGPVLGHFGERDGNINHEMVDPFVERMQEAGKPVEVHWYDADHAFANPTGDRYDQDDAKLAWQRTLDFLRMYLA